MSTACFAIATKASARQLRAKQTRLKRAGSEGQAMRLIRGLMKLAKELWMAAIEWLKRRGK
jgi:hypothetical protein